MLLKHNVEVVYKLFLENLGGDIVVAVDSSGMKVTDRGEWIRNKWKIRKDR